jgi:hypothetical protein
VSASTATTTLHSPTRCDKHCEYNDAQPESFSHGRRDRDVRYARTIVNAHYEG